MAAKAAAILDESITTLNPCGSRLELGRAFYHRALLRHVIGAAEAAQDDAQRAFVLFEESGARRDHERAAELLR